MIDIDLWRTLKRRCEKINEYPATHHGHNALAFAATAFEIHEGSIVKAVIGVVWCGFALVIWINGEDLL
jgi:hypothetical protein